MLDDISFCEMSSLSGLPFSMTLCYGVSKLSDEYHLPYRVPVVHEYLEDQCMSNQPDGEYFNKIEWTKGEWIRDIKASCSKGKVKD